MKLVELIPDFLEYHVFITPITEGVKDTDQFVGMGLATPLNDDVYTILCQGFDVTRAAGFTGLTQDLYESAALPPDEFSRVIEEQLPPHIPRWLYNKGFFQKFASKDDVSWGIISKGPVFDVGEVSSALDIGQWPADETYSLAKLSTDIPNLLAGFKKKAASFTYLKQTVRDEDALRLPQFKSNVLLLKRCVEMVLAKDVKLA